ncbi:SGNH/GDSL hydrolase family protein [Larkinella sp. GY13]|uniref:SGNH/GDSL hydrolase family protein n=1 Tax=Larkinella sp. GY13 TaxID=3453720 RepID=UPI003EEDB0B7
MRKITVSATFGCLFALLITLPVGLAVAQTNPVAPNPPFELKNGDRVVFLGNSLFEDDMQFGYLELALTTRFPDRDVTFRNLGWTGDNVFGVARSTITNPPTGYDLLMEHLTKAKPTLVFLGFGGIEAQDGEAGLPVFRDGLAKLIDKIDQLGAKTILLSPIPILSADTPENRAKRNAMLEVYASAMAKMASERSTPFINLFKPIQEVSQKTAITEDGIHLNETGYYYLATLLEKSLGLPARTGNIAITVSKQGAEAAAPVKILNPDQESANLKFTLDERSLPLPLPETVEAVRVIKITGLKKGFYTLTNDKTDVITASAKDWAAGVPIRQGAVFEQASRLREMILKKNDLFYFQYRPLNTTYILGFRSYEQGRHVKGLEEQNILIKWLESQIALNRTPKASVYQLTPLK